VGKCPYRRADSIRDRRPTADYRMGIHPQLADVDLAVYGDLIWPSVETLFSITPLPYNPKSLRLLLLTHFVICCYPY